MKGSMLIEPAPAKGGIPGHRARLHRMSLTGSGGIGKTLPARPATHGDRLFIEVAVRTAGGPCLLESNVRPAHGCPSGLFLLHDSP
jgi:hypothetical protein